MKTPTVIRSLPLTAVAGLVLAFSSAAYAQNSIPDTTQSSKADNSTADKNDTTTGAPGVQPGTDSTSSKDTTTALDKHPSQADTDSDTKSSSKNPPDASTSIISEKTTDREFVRKASQGGMTEVQLGQLAANKGTAQGVKDFGARMVSDHGKANAELISIASSKGITVSDKLDPKHQAMVDKMSALSGASFDKAYIDDMVADHHKDHALFSAEATSGQDSEIKAFAAKTDDTIKAHLSTIEDLQTKTK